MSVCDVKLTGQFNVYIHCSTSSGFTTLTMGTLSTDILEPNALDRAILLMRNWSQCHLNSYVALIPVQHFTDMSLGGTFSSGTHNKTGGFWHEPRSHCIKS